MLQFKPDLSGVVVEMEPVVRSVEGNPAKDRAAGSTPAIERARQILARQPTVDEIAEDELRRQRNRIAEIMAPRAPAKKLILKRHENSLVQSAHSREIAEIRAKAGRGERLTRQELMKVKAQELVEERDSIFKIMAERRSDPERSHTVAYTQGTADGIRAAISELLAILKAAETAQIEKRWALENRIAELETHRE
jgi:hypothetical protein